MAQRMEVGLVRVPTADHVSGHSGAKQSKAYATTSRDGPPRTRATVHGWLRGIRRNVLSIAADYAAFARALSEHFTVHTIERRGRGESGPQGDDYSIVKECEDVLALQAKTSASFLVGHDAGAPFVARYRSSPKSSV